MSEQNFKIEQGVRQGGVLSADLNNLYINPLCTTTSNADFASNRAIYVGLLRSLFSRSNSSTSNSQRSGDE
jgi:hypothetical protein